MNEKDGTDPDGRTKIVCGLERSINQRVSAEGALDSPNVVDEFAKHPPIDENLRPIV